MGEIIISKDRIILRKSQYFKVIFRVLIGLFVLKPFGAISQSVIASSVEKQIFDVVVAFDSCVIDDPISSPFSLSDEIYALNRFTAITDIKTDAIVNRRAKVLSQNKIRINGYFKSGIDEHWDASVEASYSTERIRYHYSLQSRYSFLSDTSFVYTYNKFDFPIRTRSSLSYFSYKLANDSYVGIGRFPMNWSFAGSKGLMLSDNVWPQDGFFLRHKTNGLKFEFFTGKINDLKSRDIRDVTAKEILDKR